MPRFVETPKETIDKDKKRRLGKGFRPHYLGKVKKIFNTRENSNDPNAQVEEFDVHYKAAKHSDPRLLVLEAFCSEVTYAMLGKKLTPKCYLSVEVNPDESTQLTGLVSQYVESKSEQELSLKRKLLT